MHPSSFSYFPKPRSAQFCIRTKQSNFLSINGFILNPTFVLQGTLFYLIIVLEIGALLIVFKQSVLRLSASAFKYLNKENEHSVCDQAYSDLKFSWSNGGFP